MGQRSGTLQAGRRLFYLHLIVYTLIGVFMLGRPNPGFAQGDWATDEGLEISGLILDSTKTKPGRDFFEFFNTHWREIKGIQYSVTIKELPDASRGSFLFVLVDDTTVYQQRLNPQPDLIEQAARQAVERVQIYLFRRQSTQKHLDEEFQY